MNNRIEIPKDKLVDFVKQVYNMSVPVGMGFLHYEEGDMSNEDAQSLIDANISGAGVSMDYVKGRCCKMHVFEEDEKLYIQDSWYDHSDTQFETLLQSIGVRQ